MPDCFSSAKLLAASILTFACVSSVWAQEADIDHGRALVETNCARCHGIGESDLSPHADAPEFRTLSERYPVDALEEAFAEGIVTGHPDMPEFEATPKQIIDIIAYLASIQPD